MPPNQRTVLSEKYKVMLGRYLYNLYGSTRGSINVQLTSCLFCLDWATLLMLNEQQFLLVCSNPNQSSRRSVIQSYFRTWWVVSGLAFVMFGYSSIQSGYLKQVIKSAASLYRMLICFLSTDNQALLPSHSLHLSLPLFRGGSFQPNLSLWDFPS